MSALTYVHHVQAQKNYNDWKIFSGQSVHNGRRVRIQSELESYRSRTF